MRSRFGEDHYYYVDGEGLHRDVIYKGHSYLFGYYFNGAGPLRASIKRAVEAAIISKPPWRQYGPEGVVGFIKESIAEAVAATPVLPA